MSDLPGSTSVQTPRPSPEAPGATAPRRDAAGLLDAAQRVGSEVAARWASDVDREARFPAETVAQLRATGLLGALVPVEAGGPGATVEEVSRHVSVIAEHCASSGLLLAMHHIQVAMIVRHGGPVLRGEVLPRVARGDVLCANANSEIGVGGDRRTSLCALQPTGDGYQLDKRASTVSYGMHADAILATARRDADSASHDQVLVVCTRPAMSFEPIGGWDTLGLRGTCSIPGIVRATVSADYVLSDYADVFARTSLPVSAVLLSSVWLGIAEAAARRAHTSVRTRARAARGAKSEGPPLAPLRLAELAVVLQELRAVVAGGATAYEAHKDGDGVLSLGFTSRLDSVKVTSSVLVGDIVQRAMAICGLAAYRNDSPESLGRHLRDAAGAPLMVSNDRALEAAARTLLVRKEL